MRPILCLALFALAVRGQSDVRQLRSQLAKAIQTPEVTEFQLRQFAMKHVKPLQVPATAAQWTAEAQRIRTHLLNDVVFHGWPKEWVQAPPKFEVVGTVESRNGYRMTKLRYEIVPGFLSSAILYEPSAGGANLPAILNVHGHGEPGKAFEFKQKRCINFAKRGMLALSLEWFAYGELGDKQNQHSFAAHLDLVGANGVGLFYLAMRKGLDYLQQHPRADKSRLGVTGLSGGGWQTITLSALDERVAVAIPVAGFASLATGIEHPEYVGNDIEQNATDFRDGQDYAHLTAMRAPRPTLLIYNAEDNCCFRAPLVKSGVYDDILPFFKLFSQEQLFGWYENVDPGTHNYQLDNRLQAYRFFSQQFKIPFQEGEISTEGEIRSADELKVGLPNDNLTILGLARKLSHGMGNVGTSGRRMPSEADRADLTKLIRYRPTEVQHAWTLASTKSKGVETRSFLFEFTNGLCATGVWVKAIATQDRTPATIILNDRGKASSAAEVADYVDRGEQVLVVDLLFFGDGNLAGRKTPEYTQLLGSIGERPLALEAAQLQAITTWFQAKNNPSRQRLFTAGIRSQVIALTAAALQPSAYAELHVHEGMTSLRTLLDQPVSYEAAPDLFCLDLLKEFDLPRLKSMAGGVKYTHSGTHQ